MVFTRPSQPPPGSGGGFNPARLKPITSSEYQWVRQLVYDKSRINLGDNKRELVMARLSKRLRACNLPSYQAYIELLESPAGAEELTNLIDSISTNHTYFFRESGHFDYLQQVALPQLCPPGKGGPPRRLRVWSAACSSGEEPYTLGIVLSEYFARVPGWDWSIDCTDISTRILAKCREGIFAADRVDKIPPELLRRYLQRGKGNWEGYYRVSEALRSKMRFQTLNLLGDRFPFTEPFQIIFCRNVMIYFDRPTQEELVNRFPAVMTKGGYLMIGHAESLTAIKHPFRMVKPAVYHLP